MASTADESQDGRDSLLLVGACVAFSATFFIYLLWTHRVFTHLAPDEATRIARAQFRRGPSRLERDFSF